MTNTAADPEYVAFLRSREYKPVKDQSDLPPGYIKMGVRTPGETTWYGDCMERWEIDLVPGLAEKLGLVTPGLVCHPAPHDGAQ